MNKKNFKSGDKVFHIQTGRVGTVISTGIIGCMVMFDPVIGNYYINNEMLELYDDVKVHEDEVMKLFQEEA